MRQERGDAALLIFFSATAHIPPKWIMPNARKARSSAPHCRCRAKRGAPIRPHAYRDRARSPEMWLSSGALLAALCAPRVHRKPSSSPRADNVEFATNYGLIRPGESPLVKGWLPIARGEGPNGASREIYRARSARVSWRDACCRGGACRNARRVGDTRLPCKAERTVGERQTLVLPCRAREWPSL